MAVSPSNLPYGARASMQPVGLFVRYEDADGMACTEQREAFESFATDELQVSATFDGEIVELAVTALQPVRLDRVRVVLRHAFASDEQVLMNGYQSWTDTYERSPWSRMRGLRNVPDRVVERWALAGGGDYALVEYPEGRGELHGFTYATFRRGEGMVLVGSLDESHGFTVIRSSAKNGEVTVGTEPPWRMMEPGERVVTGRYAITRGTVDECYDRWFQLSGIQARPARPLVGYTSWYRHYYDIDEAKLESDLAGMSALPVSAPMRERAEAAGVVRLFQIDDGYCKVGDWLEVDAQKFPRGLGLLAQKAREEGLLPGLWVAPFVCEADSRIFRECDEWLLRDEKGDPIPTGSQWSGGYALDTRNVEVRSYILDVLHTMTSEWGFGLLKVDFLYAACMHRHAGLNAGELMADAMKLVRQGVGDDTLLLGCGVPLASAFGVVDYCRIGCDVGLDWNDKPYMRFLHRERVSTKNSLANTYGRAPLDGRAFGNDPDVFFLRDDVKLSQAQRDEVLFADAELGSVFLTSDDRALWTDSMRQRYREALRVFLEKQHETLVPGTGVSGGKGER